MVDPRGLTEPLSVAETLATFVAGLVVTTGGAKGGKGPVGAKAGAATVGGDNPEMIRRARTQAADVGSDRQGRIPSLSLHSGGVPVASCRAPLEIDSRGRPTRID